ncbi:MAG: hypothetical protein D3909_18365, partial [Candidatus Electrothrix sp. ATG1]|nr:hypothetical protein [Candidatus Electrothrix sp. ATG1]
YFNQLAKSSVWDIFIALPVLILSYVIGLVVVRLAAIGFNYLRRQTVKIMVSRILLVNKFESNMLVEYHEKLVQEMELLQGTCPALVLLGIGLTLKVIMASPDIGGSLPHGKLIFAVIAVLIFMLVLVLLYMIRNIYTVLCELYAQLEENGESKIMVKS